MSLFGEKKNNWSRHEKLIMSNLISVNEDSADVAIFSFASLITSRTRGYMLIKVLFSRFKNRTDQPSPPLILLPGLVSERASIFYPAGVRDFATIKR